MSLKMVFLLNICYIVKETKKQQKLQETENQICMNLYKIFIDSGMTEDLNTDQGIQNLLFGIEKILIQANNYEKEVENMKKQRISLKSILNKQIKLGEESKIQDQNTLKQIKSLSWVSNIQTIVILALITGIFYFVHHLESFTYLKLTLS